MVSKSCPNFTAITFGHVLAAVCLTAASTQTNVINTENPGVSLFTIIAIFATVFIQTFLPPGIFKYLLFGLFTFLLGQLIRPTEEKLKQEGLLFEVLIMTLGVFIPMVILGFYDKYNILSWSNYLFTALLGLVVARIILIAFETSGYYNPKNLTTASKLVSTLLVALFGLFTTYDINLIRAWAKKCDKNPDYINSSIGLFINIFNIFSNFDRIVSD